MDCLVLPVSMLRNKCMGYRPLGAGEAAFGERENPVTVVVGKEKREFLVDPFVLEENPFRVLIETMNRSNNKKHKEEGSYLDFREGKINKKKKKKVLFVDVDAILFEHMLWLLYNDCSSLFKLNLKEIIDFYAQDN